MVGIHTIGILDDEPLILTALQAELADYYDVQFVCTQEAEFYMQLANNQPDLVLVDILLSDGSSGVEVVRRVRESYPNIKILVLSIDNRRETFRRLLDIGIDGFVSKKASSTEIVHAVDLILEGKKYYGKDVARLVREIQVAMQSGVEPVLTQREVDILYACCEGMSSQQIGQALHISARTVEAHKQTLFVKLGVSSSIELIVSAIRQGIITV